MYRVDTATAVPNLPPANPAAEGGFFTPGSPGGQPATVPGPDWFNIVQEELVAIVEAAELPLIKTNRAQLLAALQKLFVAASATPLYGRVNADGTPGRLPAGWAVARLSTGRYRVTHNLNTLALSIVLTSNLWQVVINTTDHDTHFFEVMTVQPTPVVSLDCPFSFIVFRD